MSTAIIVQQKSENRQPDKEYRNLSRTTGESLDLAPVAVFTAASLKNRPFLHPAYYFMIRDIIAESPSFAHYRKQYQKLFSKSNGFAGGAI